MTLRVAIIGGGPSAFYVTSRLLYLLPNTNFNVHIYDRLWAPHGLVRYGVAPDHPEVKNCTHKFDAAATDTRVRFFGNVNVSAQPTDGTSSPPDEGAPNYAHTLPLHALRSRYTHLVFATGATRPRLHPLLPPSVNCIPALDLVYWYTMHPCNPYSPSRTSASPPPSPIPPNTRHITVIGHGNVSLDIARILLTPPASLSTLDIPSHVLRGLNDTWSTLRHISIVGRRGPRDVRFTAKELREITSLPSARMRDAQVASKDWVEGGLTRQQARVMKLLKEGSKLGDRTMWMGKTFSIDYWRSPTGYTILPPSHSPDRSHAVLHLEETCRDPGTGTAVGTGRHESVCTDLIVTSLGYEGDATLFSAQPWYDPSAGRIRTQAGGRVVELDGRVVPNVYAAGWAARGAHGVLAGTLLDAYDVAAALIADWRSTAERVEGLDEGQPDSVPPSVEAALLEGTVLEYDAWRKVEKEERRRGGGKKERERMGWGDVLQFLRHSE